MQGSVPLNHLLTHPFLSAAGHFMVEFGCSGVFWWPSIWMFQSKKLIELGRHTLLSRLRTLKPGMSRRGFPGFFQHCVGFIWVGASEISARRVSIFGKSQGCICQPWSDFIRWSSTFTRTRRWVGMPLRPLGGIWDSVVEENSFNNWDLAIWCFTTHRWVSCHHEQWAIVSAPNRSKSELVSPWRVNANSLMWKTHHERKHHFPKGKQPCMDFHSMVPKRLSTSAKKWSWW